MLEVVLLLCVLALYYCTRTDTSESFFPRYTHRGTWDDLDNYARDYGNTRGYWGEWAPGGGWTGSPYKPGGNDLMPPSIANTVNPNAPVYGTPASPYAATTAGEKLDRVARLTRRFPVASDPLTLAHLSEEQLADLQRSAIMSYGP